jgi:acyl transferase domain-containing protein/NADPH-dependent curcumin reductase CurA/thioesterase domain-containing protein/acyl carrier protein
VYLGSLKSNIGHTQAAAGVGGVIKMVQALRHEQLPQTLWADEPSPHVDWDAGELELLDEPVAWPAGERVRRAGVSSFGMSGTNAHVVLEEAPPAGPSAAEPAGAPPEIASRVLPFVVSASSEAGLVAQAQRLGEYVASRPELGAGAVAGSLASGRAQLGHRAVAVVGGLDELAESLGAFARGSTVESLVTGPARPARRDRRVGFVFPGQGGQWEGMAVALWDASPVFAEHMRACAEALAEFVDWSLEDVLRGAGGRDGVPSLERVDVVQPALFAVMVSLARLWESYGVRPAAVVGHSQGEIAAAHIAGALSLQDAARVVAVRSQVLSEMLSGQGGMVAVGAASERVAAYLDDYDGRVSLAAVNSPTSVVVSGEPAGLQDLIARCEADGVPAKLLAVDYAAHSAQIEVMRERLLEEFAPVRPRAGDVPLFSTVTGERLDTATMDAEYWYNNLRHTVRFDEAVGAMVAGGIGAVVETGPHPVLSTQVVETIEAAGHDADAVPVIGSLRRADGGLERFIRSLAEAHVTGIDIDWSRLLGATAHVALPTYAFQRERYWLAPGNEARDPSALGQAPAQHPLLDATIALAAGQGTLFTGRLSLERHPWLADHVVMGQVVLPATAFLDLALHVGTSTGAPVIDELTLSAPLPLRDGQTIALQVTVTEAEEDGRRQLAIHSRVDGSDAVTTDWTQHAAATLAPDSAGDGADLRRLADMRWPPADGEALGGDLLYDQLADAGYEYGAAFQGLAAAWRRGDEIDAQAALAEGQEQHASAYGLHPALLDAVLQGVVLGEIDAGNVDAPVAPFSFTGVRLHAQHASEVRASLVTDGAETRIAVVDGSGAPVLSIEAFSTRPLDQRGLRATPDGSSDALYAVQWEELSASAAEALRIVALGDGETLGGERHADLDALGEALADGAPTPDVVLVGAGAHPTHPAHRARSADPVTAIHEQTARALELLKAFLESEPLAGARLVFVTRGGVAVDRREAPDLTQAAVVGLLRSAHSEHPDRFSVLDLDGSEPPPAVLAAALADQESVMAVRDGVLLAPRLAHIAPDPTAMPRVGGRPWRLRLESPGTLDGLGFADSEDAGRPLGPGEVRIAVHAAGLNFKDVVVALDLVGDDDDTIGLEGAGVVLETGAGVTDLAPGDRVMGLIAEAFGSVVVTDRRLVVEVPAGWTDVQAASVPVVFLTAYHALVERAGVQAGESLLVHGAAGGVGMAALQIARHLGAEVFATAHPSKWPALAGLGLAEARIASSRSTDFRETFLQATDGRGVDVVLDSLAGEMVDASLDLLPRGGRFVELGKTDIRDAEQVAAEHPGVRYQAFDLLRDVDPERIQELLVELVALFERGALQHVPISTWDVRDATEAFRFLRESKHVGKLVLRVPRPLDPDGTVLITGGTGGLGAMLATHLAERHGARHLLLASRSGPDAEGAGALVASLAQRGCETTVAACDVTDRAQLERLLAEVPADHPLTAVMHLAGAFDDGVIAAQDAQRLRRVMHPKVDPAIHLHELTRELDLAEFLMYSSTAATLGLPGQSNYAAANAVLDALAQRRRVEGLPGMSLGLGVWQTATALTRRLTGADGEVTRAAGMIALPDEEGLDLVDEARALDQPLLLPVLFDRQGLRAQARAGVLAPILRRLFGGASRAAVAPGGSFAAKLAAAPEAQRARIALDLTREHLAAVLGIGAPAGIDEQRTFKELGVDSLTGVELRNRIARASGLSLPATLVFDHPTPAAVATLLRARVEEQDDEAPGDVAPGPRRVDGEDPIVIVGIGCRFPGGVQSAEDLWDLVAAGRDVIGDYPTDRGWDLERLLDPDPERAGTIRMRQGGFLYDAGDFDAEHFLISPREALTMDPQQRLLLECAWEALEDAGIDPHTLRGSLTGVFAGVFESGYVSTNDAPELTGFRVLGGVNAAMSGRVSYVLGLEGPAVSVDTACSSSLVSLHLGAQALRAGECDLVLAGGVTVVANPEIYAEFSLQGALSDDGRCRAFGAGANGTGLSEGAGLLVLERLSDAERNGHEVLAVVRASAINQDGASNGMSAPNGPAQERVIRAALASAGLSTADVDAVEAHGTGTSLGDPLEAGALLATYGQGRTDGAAGPVYLGSLKSNIGHTQAAAGVGGVIKMVQALRHEELPRTLYADQPSPHIDWDSGEIQVLTEPVPWPAGEHVRRAGVSAFGLSGTNAHVVLEEAPGAGGSESRPTSDDAAPEIGSRVLPFLVSASSEAGLAAQAQRLARHVEAHPELEPAAVAGSLALGRAQLAHRAVALVGGVAELAETLDRFARGEFVESVVTGPDRPVRRTRRAAFVFPGQGGQWDGMAVALWDASPVFAEHMRACAEALAEFVDWSLEDVLRGAQGAPTLERVDVVQPALFAVMVSLARLWESYGVAPAAVVGHSQGEIAAAHIAGALTLQDAARVVAVRSQVLSEMLSGQGGMVAVGTSAERAATYLEDYDGRVSLAAVNSPTSVVVSGEPAGLEDLIARCQTDGVPAKRLAVDYAAHSAQIEVMRERLLEEFAPVTALAGDVPLFSTVTGERLDTTTMDAEYWYNNLRQTVRFEPAMRELLQTGADALVEIGPHPVLATPLAEILDAGGDPDAVAVMSTLQRADGGLERIIRSLAEAHVAGVSVDWAALFGSDAAARVALPTYAFQHRRYWLAPGTDGGDPTALGQNPGRHPLLHASITLAGDQGTVFTGRLSPERQPWLADHVVLGRILVPAAVFVDLALHAGVEIGAPAIEELTLTTPLVLDGAHDVALQVTVSGPEHDGRRRLTIHSRVGGSESAGWTSHATATLAPEQDAAERDAVAPRPAGATAIEFDEFYDRLEQAGIAYGPAFQGVTRMWEHDGEVLAELSAPDAEGQESSALLSVVLDAALQPASLLCSERGAGEPVLVASCHDVWVDAAGEPATAHLRVDAGAGTAQVLLADADGHPVAALRATLGAAAVGDLAGADQGPPRDALLKVAWQEASSPAANGAHYMLLGSPNGLTALDVEAHPDLGSVAASIDPAHHSVAVAFADFRTPAGEQATAEGAHAAAKRALELLQAWLRDERLTDGRLVVVTHGAVAAREDDTVPDLAAAAVWGLVRSAQSEHPDRFVLADLDETEASRAAVLGAVISGEPQLALREGRMLVPRLAPVASPADGPDLERVAEGTVLVVGGTTGVGAVLAHQLVAAHGVRSLLVTSRRGMDAPGAAALAQELSALGATVEVAACDVTDRHEVEALLRRVPAERPLSGVVHCATLTDNGLVESLTAEQIDRALAPKVDGALHLHELTQDLDLGCFVVCSSMAATFGGPGQGNYAAANAFLDALAEHRHARGLAGLSIQWGLWADVGQSRAVAGKLDQSLGRLSGSASFRPFSEEVGRRLFDGALATGLPFVIASPYRLDVVRQEVQAATAPRLLTALVRTRVRSRTRPPASVAGASTRRKPVAQETQAQIAAALGYESLDTHQMRLSFLELGFDSLVSLELRKRLQALTGVTLPSSVMFDHPSPAALVAHLSGLLGEADGGAGEVAPAAAAPPSDGNGAEGPLMGMFRRAYQLGKLKDGIAMAEAAASLRPRFGVSHVDDEAPAVVPLTAGADADGPILFCIPSLVASSGPHEYARFAKSFRGRREVVAVPVPGFASGELLAARLDAAAGAMAAAIGRHASDRAVALVGFSTGGLLAHAVAAECVRQGIAPTAVVLIDSYTMETAWPIADVVIDRMLVGDGAHPAIDDDRLTAMGAYLAMLSRWAPPAPAAPTLLIKASDPVPGVVQVGDWTASWTQRDAAVVAPGTHLTILEDHVETTARAVEDWLDRHHGRNGARSSAARRRLPFRGR